MKTQAATRAALPSEREHCCANPFCGERLLNPVMRFCETKRHCQLLRNLVLNYDSQRLLAAVWPTLTALDSATTWLEAQQSEVGADEVQRVLAVAVDMHPALTPRDPDHQREEDVNSKTKDIVVLPAQGGQDPPKKQRGRLRKTPIAPSTPAIAAAQVAGAKKRGRPSEVVSASLSPSMMSTVRRTRSKGPCSDLQAPPVKGQSSKLIQEGLPAGYALCATAVPIHINTSVVYRIRCEIISVRTFGSTTGASVSPPRRAQSWVTTMTLAKFRSLYSKVGAILLQPCVTEYLSRPNTDKWEPLETFLELLKHVFDQYKHLEVAFNRQAHAAATERSAMELELFLGECWSALEVILPILALQSNLPVLLLRGTVCICQLVRDFLAIPESFLGADCIFSDTVSA